MALAFHVELGLELLALLVATHLPDGLEPGGALQRVLQLQLPLHVVDNGLAGEDQFRHIYMQTVPACEKQVYP